MVRYIQRRVETRSIHKSPVKIQDLKTGLYHKARMVNFSNSGLHFESDHLLEVGAQIYIGIENSPFAALTDVYDVYQANIIWRCRLDSVFYQYGYGVQLSYTRDKRYLHVSGFKELLIYLRKMDTRSISFSSRRQLHRGFIKKISPKGVFIQTSESLSVGQKIKLIVPENNRISAAIITGQVVRVGASGIAVRFETAMRANDGKNSTELH